MGACRECGVEQIQKSTITTMVRKGSISNVGLMGYNKREGRGKND